MRVFFDVFVFFFFNCWTGVARFCYPLSTIFLCFYSSFSFSFPFCLCFSRRLFSLISITNKSKRRRKKQNNPMMRLWFYFGREKSAHSWILLCRYEFVFLVFIGLWSTNIIKLIQYWHSYQTDENDPNL